MAESVTPNRAYAFPATSRFFVCRGEKDDRYEDLDKEGDRGEEDDRGEDLGKGEDRGEEDDRDEDLGKEEETRKTIEVKKTIEARKVAKWKRNYRQKQFLKRCLRRREVTVCYNWIDSAFSWKRNSKI